MFTTVVDTSDLLVHLALTTGAAHDNRLALIRALRAFTEFA